MKQYEIEQTIDSLLMENELIPEMTYDDVMDVLIDNFDAEVYTVDELNYGYVYFVSKVGNE